MPKKEKFYKNGLYFGCTECGQCCSNPGGYVSVSEAEAASIADHLEISEVKFWHEYVESHGADDTLNLRSHENGDCIFLKDNRCTIYAVRPLQCSTYPFWPENLKSAYRWRTTAKSCPGINVGEFYSEVDIEQILQRIKKQDHPHL